MGRNRKIDYLSFVNCYAKTGDEMEKHFFSEHAILRMSGKYNGSMFVVWWCEYNYTNTTI